MFKKPALNNNKKCILTSTITCNELNMSRKNSSSNNTNNKEVTIKENLENNKLVLKEEIENKDWKVDDHTKKNLKIIGLSDDNQEEKTDNNKVNRFFKRKVLGKNKISNHNLKSNFTSVHNRFETKFNQNKPNYNDSKLPSMVTENDLKRSKKGLLNDGNREIQASTIKKEFIAENLLKNAKTKEEIDKILGKEKKEIQKLRESHGNEMRKILKEQLYSLPEHLKVPEEQKDDYIVHLLELSQCGLIEVPLPLEERLKSYNEIEKNFKTNNLLDSQLAEDVDYIKILKNNGPRFSSAFETEMKNRKEQQLTKTYKEVFESFNGRKRRNNQFN